MPTARNALDANVLDGKIYMIGGGRRGPQYDNFVMNQLYDPITDSWTTKTPLPTGVQWYVSVVVNNKIYIIRDSLNQIYDSETDTWNSGAPPPITVDQPAAGVTAGDTETHRIYIIGGLQNLDAVNLNQVYDPETDTWVAGPAMPTARFALGVTVLNDSLYAIGGHEGWIGTPISAANERYTPADFIPEFPSWIILPLIISVSLIVLVLRKRLSLFKRIDERLK